jgi:inosine-uridine nucleoside N-ribohydrolase
MKRIVLDCDPGNDDALGILVAAGHPGLSLAAVTTGAGHLAADRTAHNAARMVAMLGGDLPHVAAGAAGPLVRKRLIATILDMESGLDPKRDDLPSVPFASRHSAELILEQTEREPGLTVVTTGPLTNLALALRSDHRLAARIGRIVMLGGSWGLGNKTAAAEWNILCDPEAAAIVFGAGIPCTMIPIDAAAAVQIDDELVAAVARTDTPCVAFALELLRSLRSTYRAPLFGPADAPLNDPCASLVAAEPALVQTVPAHVEIECAGRHTYGRSVIDFAGRSGPVNCDVVVRFDVAATRAAFVAALARAAQPLTRTKAA